jgi:hypothetical protein
MRGVLADFIFPRTYYTQERQVLVWDSAYGYTTRTGLKSDLNRNLSRGSVVRALEYELCEIGSTVAICRRLPAVFGSQENHFNIR